MSFFPSRRDLSISYQELVVEVRKRERERLDVYLLRLLGWKSRARIQKAIAAGRVRVNGARGKSSQRVTPGDRIQIHLDPREASLPAEHAPLLPPIWEDPYLVVLDKPAGWLVHPVGRSTTGTVLNELHARYGGCNRQGRRAVLPMLCHRLDRETSGVLLAAKTDAARRRLQEAFEQGQVGKRYLAVVEGELAQTRMEIRLPIAVLSERAQLTGNTLSVVHPQGKPALTIVEKLGVEKICSPGGSYSIVLCHLKTGRQNQIRAHLAGIGHPILGDQGYGSKRASWPSEHPSGLAFPERALLHSRTLSFPHPVWGHILTCSAEPPADMRGFLTDSSYA